MARVRIVFPIFIFMLSRTLSVRVRSHRIDTASVRNRVIEEVTVDTEPVRFVRLQTEHALRREVDERRDLSGAGANSTGACVT